MKQGLVKQVYRLLLPTRIVECRPVFFFNDGGVRGMATTTEILLASSRTQDRVAETTSTKAPPRAPSVPKPRWYRPDPVTGTWLLSEGEETTGVVTESMAPPAVITAGTSDSTREKEKRWWTSMEELPDMERPKDL